MRASVPTAAIRHGHDSYVIGELLQLLQLVTRHEAKHCLLGEAGEQVEEVAPADRVDAGKAVRRDQQFGIVDEAAPT